MLEKYKICLAVDENQLSIWCLGDLFSTVGDREDCSVSLSSVSGGRKTAEGALWLFCTQRIEGGSRSHLEPWSISRCCSQSQSQSPMAYKSCPHSHTAQVAKAASTETVAQGAVAIASITKGEPSTTQFRGWLWRSCGNWFHRKDSSGSSFRSKRNESGQEWEGFG